MYSQTMLARLVSQKTRQIDMSSLSFREAECPSRRTSCDPIVGWRDRQLKKECIKSGYSTRTVPLIFIILSGVYIIFARYHSPMCGFSFHRTT